MLIIFQLFFTVFILAALSYVLKRRKESLLGIKGVLFWTIFWILGLFVIWVPETTSKVAQMFGIGRGADLIVYFSIAILFFVMFRLHIKIESIGRDITKLVREKSVQGRKEDSDI